MGGAILFSDSWTIWLFVGSLFMFFIGLEGANWFNRQVLKIKITKRDAAHLGNRRVALEGVSSRHRGVYGHSNNREQD